MATSYISTATARSEGLGFSLSAGASRQFYCVPALGPYEVCTLEISPDSGTTWAAVGDICTNDDQIGTVTARGAGASYFRVIKGATESSTVVYYD